MEEWKDCYGYEDCYEISNLGNIRSKPNRQNTKRQGRLIKTHQGKNDYIYVCLSKDGTSKTWNIHRLVALTFLDNPLNLSQVDHIDRNKSNNVVTNLRWVSNAENQANRGMPKNNTSGEMYITVLYRVSIIRNGVKTQKAFNSMEEAKQFRLKELGF